MVWWKAGQFRPFNRLLRRISRLSRSALPAPQGDTGSPRLLAHLFANVPRSKTPPVGAHLAISQEGWFRRSAFDAWESSQHQVLSPFEAPPHLESEGRITRPTCLPTYASPVTLLLPAQGWLPTWWLAFSWMGFQPIRWSIQILRLYRHMSLPSDQHCLVALPRGKKRRAGEVR